MLLMPRRTSNLPSVLLFFLLLLSTALPAAEAPLLTQLRGEAAPGALMIGKVLPGTRVTLDGEDVHVASSGDFVFGFSRDAEGDSVLDMRRQDAVQTLTLSLKPRAWNIQRVEGVPQETVTPPPERLARIRAEAALVRQARSGISSRLDVLEPFVWPATGPITGVYGSQRFYNGEPRNPHYGVDIAGPTGAPVFAPAGGVVRLVHDDMFYSGGTLVIDHGFGVTSTFIHLHKIHVVEGAVVKQGEPIAEIGSSGRATGPHLDWRLNWHNVRLDPQWFMGGEGLEAVRANDLAGPPKAK